LHFHYSGHGVNNAKIVVEEDEKKRAIESNITTQITKTPVGECLVGSSGELYSLHDVKHELVKLHAETIVISLDCCRSELRGSGRGLTCGEVKLQKKEAISQEDQEKIVVLYGSLDGHSSSDSRSFTKELFKVTDEGNISIPILKLASKVNQSWKDTNQRCKADLVEVGDNWNDFHWPFNEKDEDFKNCTENQARPGKKEVDSMLIFEKLEKMEAGLAGVKEDINIVKGDVEVLKKKEMLSVESPARKRRTSSTEDMS